MRSLLRFGAFVAAMALVVAAAVWWKDVSTRLTSVEERGSLLAALDQEFTALVSRVLPAVVSIDAMPAATVDPRVHLFQMLLGVGKGEMPPQLGSGVIVSAEGHIVTNWHVIQGAAAATVHLSDGRMFPAKLVGADRRSDIAVLSIAADGLQPAEWGDSDAVRIGQGVFAVGNPLGLQETVTQGIISGKGRRDLSEAANEFFQTDAAINQGNSGGPLFDLEGKLIGITNMVAAGGEGVAFAIPSNTARRVFESIRDHGRSSARWFGALVQPLTPALARQLGIANPKGALLLGTYDGSPASLAGLQPGDVIVAFNGRPILDHIDLRNRLMECAIGERVAMRIVRKGEEREAVAVIAAEPGS